LFFDGGKRGYNEAESAPGGVEGAIRNRGQLLLGESTPKGVRSDLVVASR